ncbi:radical SAM protein [Kutzneria sp. CA-103260]|uniref:radical SAM protein n=1 Tax=Kutzneria sp. CA-103260 TaxID=2802641 RepID=UPI001BA6A14F|nr:radical SAM protein [Kutzneria sp. CA-103260]QUQ68814.1 GTP 3',8-cyclase [Kutzneria sp. CA-103260]
MRSPTLSVTRSSSSWPLPHTVAGYGDEEAFRRSRKEAGQWVFWRDRVDLVLAGRYDEVKPLHVEVSPTYLCNFACPWCSCRSAREEWSETDVFNHPRATPLTVMREAKLDHVLEHLAEHQVGIMWVGGEPTMNPALYPAALRAHALGLQQCVFTNGSLLNADRIGTLFDANFVFVRVSLNAVTEEVHQRHHDYDPRLPYTARVLDNLEQLAEERAKQRSDTQVGVSIVVDERNLEDLAATAEHLVRLVERHGRDSLDYAIFRPAFPFYSAELDMRPETVDRFLDAVGAGSPWHRRMTDAGIDVVIPDDSVPDGTVLVEDVPFADDLGCLSAGWFGEVTPNGDHVLCSDRYGNPDYFIGNVAANGIDDLWSGDRRQTVLDLARTSNCYGTYCPRNGRGFHLNRVFRQIESLRRQGRLDEVRAWIEDLRTVLPEPKHSFFL